MADTTLPAIVAAAVLVFWAVGAYNRLVRLRNDLLRAFPAVDAQFQARQAALMRWAEGLAAQAQPADAQALAALHAAARQAETACGHARAHPARAGAVTSLRLAEDILAHSRAALGPDGEGPDAALAEADTALAFARRRFNETAELYNHAVSQFPTWVIAAVFGFRKAGTL
ncbi:LemA family protein [Piscinibacter sp.]|uniref:LemA family protein n=1 Tax=Piscinibacter sp. TaxID=1903157 RepID=UPI0039E551E7